MFGNSFSPLVLILAVFAQFFAHVATLSSSVGRVAFASEFLRAREDVQRSECIKHTIPESVDSDGKPVPATVRVVLLLIAPDASFEERTKICHPGLSRTLDLSLRGQAEEGQPIPLIYNPGIRGRHCVVQVSGHNLDWMGELDPLLKCIDSTIVPPKKDECVC